MGLQEKNTPLSGLNYEGKRWGGPQSNANFHSYMLLEHMIFSLISQDNKDPIDKWIPEELTVGYDVAYLPKQ